MIPWPKWLLYGTVQLCKLKTETERFSKKVSENRNPKKAR